MERPSFYCVKWGTKYTAEHVNRLYRMVEKNTSLPFTFTCFTDDVTGLDPNVKTWSLDEGLSGWWNKIYLFDRCSDGLNIYFDLDVVIQNNLDWLIKDTGGLQLIDYSWHNPWDPSRMNRYHHDLSYNSSVMIWKGRLREIVDTFFNDPNLNMKLFRGLDGFLSSEIPNAMFDSLPEGAVYSRTTGCTFKQLQSNNQLFFEPSYTICIFNNANDEKYYNGYEKFFL